MSGFKPFIQGIGVGQNTLYTPIDDTQSGMPPLIPIFNANTFIMPLTISSVSSGIKANRRKCCHNRIKDDCKFCIGKNICEHGRIKRRCTKCGVGPSICVHKRQKIQCVTCGGNGICIHGKRRNTCRDCGGVSFCIHSKYPHTCIPCGGKYLCEHKKVSKKCRTCKALNESIT